MFVEITAIDAWQDDGSGRGGKTMKVRSPILEIGPSGLYGRIISGEEITGTGEKVIYRKVRVHLKRNELEKIAAAMNLKLIPARAGKEVLRALKAVKTAAESMGLEKELHKKRGTPS